MQTLLTTTRLFFLLTTVMMLASWLAKGQPLTGGVSDQLGTPLPGVVLRLDRPAGTRMLASGRSNAAGHFRISFPDTGRFVLNVSFKDFETTNLNVSNKLPIPFIRLVLNPLPRQLDTVTIKTSREPMVLEADRIRVNVSSSGLFSGGSVVDILGKTTGIVLDRLARSLCVDGKRGLQVYLNDRQVLLRADQVYAYLESLPVAGINRLELITAPSARYDAAGGAVISLYTKRVVADRVS